MTKKRAMELLNAMIDYMHIAENCNTVIKELLKIGFTADELIDEFGYSLTDVQEAEAEMEEE